MMCSECQTRRNDLGRRTKWEIYATSEVVVAIVLSAIATAHGISLQKPANYKSSCRVCQIGRSDREMNIRLSEALQSSANVGGYVMAILRTVRTHPASSFHMRLLQIPLLCFFIGIGSRGAMATSPLREFGEFSSVCYLLQIDGVELATGLNERSISARAVEGIQRSLEARGISKPAIDSRQCLPPKKENEESQLNLRYRVTIIALDELPQRRIVLVTVATSRSVFASPEAAFANNAYLCAAKEAVNDCIVRALGSYFDSDLMPNIARGLPKK